MNFIRGKFRLIEASKFQSMHFSQSGIPLNLLLLLNNEKSFKLKKPLMQMLQPPLSNSLVMIQELSQFLSMEQVMHLDLALQVFK